MDNKPLRGSTSIPAAEAYLMYKELVKQEFSEELETESLTRTRHLFGKQRNIRARQQSD